MTDRETQTHFLKEAERHVAEGEKHIADQERLVSALRRDGHDATKARDLLELLRETQAQYIVHRDFLLNELKQ